jgi:hypothetical protein
VSGSVLFRSGTLPPSFSELVRRFELFQCGVARGAFASHVIRHDQRGTAPRDHRIAVGEVENESTAVVMTFREKESAAVFYEGIAFDGNRLFELKPFDAPSDSLG